MPPKPLDEAAEENTHLNNTEALPELESNSEASFFDISSLLSPFCSSNGGRDSGSENTMPEPAFETRKQKLEATTTAGSSTSNENNTTTSDDPDGATPRSPLGRGGRRRHAMPSKPAAAPGTSASGKPAATPANVPQTTTKTSPRKQPAAAPDRLADATDAMDQTSNAHLDPTKQGLPSSSDLDEAGEAVKKLCVLKQNR